MRPGGQRSTVPSVDSSQGAPISASVQSRTGHETTLGLAGDAPETAGSDGLWEPYNEAPRPAGLVLPDPLGQKGGGPSISMAPVAWAASRTLSKSTGGGSEPGGAGSLAWR